MTALFQANDILIRHSSLCIYAVLQANDICVDLLLLYPRKGGQPETYHIPTYMLQTARKEFVHISRAGELKSCAYPGLVKLGWNPDEGRSAIGWAIARIEQLEAMLKNA